MTVDSAPPPPPPAAPPPAAPPPVAERPGIVTAAGVTLIVLSVLTLLLALILLIGVGLFAGAAGSMPDAAEIPAGFEGMFGAFAGAFLVFTLIVAAFGVLQLVSGIQVLGGRSWARVTGIVVAAIAGLLSLAGIGGGDSGGVVIGLALVAANAFVIWALATTGPWFAARSAP